MKLLCEIKRTPLISAILNGNIEIVKVLLSHPAINLNISIISNIFLFLNSIQNNKFDSISTIKYFNKIQFF